MVVRVSQAMIVPLSLQGGVNGCSLANKFHSSRDLCLQSVPMEQKSKGGVENCNQGGHDNMLAWQRTASEGSISSIDSLPGAEPGVFSPSDLQQSIFRKARLSVSESDDESFLELMQEEYSLKKLKRPITGATVQPHSAMAQAMDEGDPEAGLVTTRSSPVGSEEGRLFRLGGSPPWCSSSRFNCSRLDKFIDCLGSADAFVPRRYVSSKLAGGFSSCKALSDAESLSNTRNQSESHLGTCSVGMGSAAQDHSSTPSDDGKDFPSSRVKFMCSFGGKILPRPSDGKLRYVGGETRIIAIHRDINFADLKAKMKDVYGQALTFKYQAPDEDLDALISVSSDDDLEIMMEEYDKLEAEGSSRLRVFLFSGDSESGFFHKDSGGDLRNSEQRYVDAVNGIPEVVSRRQSDSAGGSAPLSLDLLGLEMAESWPHGADTVPMALIAPHLSHDPSMIQVPVALPVSNIQSRSNAPSAPSSAPSSPPLLSRPAHGKLAMASDLHLQYLQDSHLKVGGPQYNVMASEGAYQDNESYGGSGASSGASQHEMLYRSSDSRRGPESPPKKYHEVLHPDHPIAVDQRRLSGTKMPRVSSHGKLTRLPEHVELAPSSRVDSQLFPDVHLAPVEIQRLLHQQPSLQQNVWQHPLDPSQDGYRRPELLQSTVAQASQQQQGYPQQQIQSILYRSGLSQTGGGHEGAYRQGDQQSQQPQQFQEDLLHSTNFIPRTVSSQAIAPGVAPGQSTSYHVGSAPSSPRPGFREVPPRHLAGAQQLQMHWPFNNAAYVEQQPQFGRRVSNYGDQSNRTYRQSSSPPRYRDHLAHADERLLRQTQQVPEALHHDQVSSSAQLLFETSGVSQAQYDLLSRPQVPQYKGHNPFQDKLVPYQDHSDISESRRHILQQGKESQLSGQQHLHQLHTNQRIDFQDSLSQPVESMHSLYPENQEKAGEWMVQDRERAQEDENARARLLAKFREEEMSVESGVAHPNESQQGIYPGLHLPETSEDLLTQSLGEYAGGSRRNERHGSPSAFQFRHGMLPPSTLAGYSGSRSRSNLTDTSHGAQHLSRLNDADYLAVAGLRGGVTGQDLRAPGLFEINGHQHVSSQMRSGPHRLADERTVASAFNPMTQLHNLRINDNMALNSDLRWGGGPGSEDLRNEVQSHGRDRVGNLFEDRLQGLAGLAMGRVGGKLSRPSSSTNVPSLIDEQGEAPHLLHVNTYSTQNYGTSFTDEDHLSSHITQNIQAIDNPLYSSSVSYGTTPSIPLDPSLGTSTGMMQVRFDSSLAGSSISDFQKAQDDLPNIKTTATQIPSIGDHDSAGSRSSGGRSDNSRLGTDEVLGGQPTMDQRTIDMVVAALEMDQNGSNANRFDASLIKTSSQLELKGGHSHGDSEEEVLKDGEQTDHGLDSAPTFSEFLLDLKLGDAEMTREQISLDTEGNRDSSKYDHAAVEYIETITSTHDGEPHEDAQIRSPEEEDDDQKVSSTGLISDPATKAMKKGLQTIKNADLEELRELGSGTFGTVYHGKWRGTDVAIKRIKASCFAGRPSEQERLIEDFWREACNLGGLHHPNVVAFYGVVADGPGGTLATVTEYMVNGSLKQVLQKKDRTIDRRKRLLIAMDAAFGMEYLHGKNIVHFDLKCENLLVNMRDPHRPICKVGDLGLSKVKHQTMVSGGVRGTLPWMAPELLNGCSSLVTEKVDVFSFGIVMWELLTGEEPYDKMHYGAIIGGIVNNTLRPPIPKWCDPAWRSLMERCWANEPASRPSFSEIASELRTMAAALQPRAQGQAQGQSNSQPPMPVHA